ncbi:MAG TPA: hypothetical protein VH413_11080 [Verrucomicrobiae bacterium]|nr:hypothetical protein [Verrucomicrobiae bacterium]
MKNFSLSLWLLVAFTISLAAETLPERYAAYGDLLVVKLGSAPFPHPDRAQGHKYHNEIFTAETNYSDSSVAMFVPKGFRQTDRTDFVIHFHGWRNHIETVLSQYQLIEQFSRSGRNAILIVPQGPRDAPDSFGGKLEDTNGFKRFMTDVVTTLHDRGMIHSTNIGDIILSGHSGGYQVMSSIVARGGLSSDVKEVWLFDALYARTEQFTNWFNAFPDRRLIDIYTEHGGTKEETEKLIAALKAQNTPLFAKNESDATPEDLKANRLIFLYSALEHNDVLSKHDEFYEYLTTSRLKPIKTGATP